MKELKNSVKDLGAAKPADGPEHRHSLPVGGSKVAAAPAPASGATPAALSPGGGANGANKKKATTIGRSKFPPGAIQVRCAASACSLSSRDAQEELQRMEAAEKAAQPVDLELPKDKKSRVVDLSNKELGRLPPELAEYTDLQLLTLKKNKLNTLGPEIGAYPSRASQSCGG